jgi:hypothetical protein
MGNRRTTFDEKLGMCIRMLASTQDEVLAGARALTRTLKYRGQDIHVLAERIEKPNGNAYDEAELKRVWDDGYQTCARDIGNKQHGPEDFRNIDGTPSWHEIARFCQQHKDRLRDSEQQFIDNVTSRTVWRKPTEREGKWLRSIFYKLGGRI